MRVRIEDLPEEGQEILFNRTDDWAREAASASIEGAVSELEGHFQVMRVGPGVQVQGTLRAQAARTCDRCMADVRLSVSGTVSLYYDVYRGSDEAEACLHVDELDVGFYDGVELDLAAALSEYLALETPPRLFCGDAGVERIEPGTCALAVAAQPDDAPLDPRFAVLQGLRLPPSDTSGS